MVAILVVAILAMVSGCIRRTWYGVCLEIALDSDLERTDAIVNRMKKS